jgi:ATP/maltotriose-dependent transcriptional regulator MalT
VARSNRCTAKATPGDGASQIPPQQLASAVAKAAERDGWRAGAALIEHNWDRLATTAPQHLLAAIRALPGDAFVDRPTFVVAANYLQHLVAGGNPSRFNNDGLLDASMTGSEIDLMEALTLLTGRSAGARTSGQLDDARRAVEEARDALRQAAEPERSAIRVSLPHFRLQWGRSLELCDAPGAELEYEEAYELAILTDQLAVGRRAAAHRAWLDADRGRLNSAELWLARALNKPAANGRYDAVVFLTAAFLRLDRGDLAGARQELARTTGLGDGEHWAAVLWVQARIAHDAASATIVDTHLTQQLASRPEAVTLSGANGRYVRAARARLSLLRGRSAQISIADSRLSRSDELIAATLAHRDRRYEEVLQLARPAAASDEPPRTQAAALLVTAAAELNLRHRITATTMFRQAHALIEDERIYSLYEYIPPGDLEQLAEITGLVLPRTRSLFRTHKSDRSTLSKREHEILTLLAQGNSMSEISEALFISANTLKTTVRRLYRKLSVGSRAAAVDAAQQAELL